MTIRIGIIGARGHTGKELLSLIVEHPHFELAAASSRALNGQAVATYLENPNTDVMFENLDVNQLPILDAWILALPNGYARQWMSVIAGQQPACVVCDLSADHRFDDDWYYGLPELNRQNINKNQYIANPGCYATAMQLAISPVKSWLASPPVCFGVSGFSGAGTKPCDKNDSVLLKDNLLPYNPTDHLHQSEVTHHLGNEVHFTPHVAEFFRGISMTVSMTLNRRLTLAEVRTVYTTAYENEPMITLDDNIPFVADNRYRHHACVGGWTLSSDNKRLVVFSTLDNLLKGAASQAIQNLNNAFGLIETQGLPHV